MRYDDTTRAATFSDGNSGITPKSYDHNSGADYDVNFENNSYDPRGYFFR